MKQLTRDLLSGFGISFALLSWLSIVDNSFVRGLIAILMGLVLYYILKDEI